MAITTCAMAIDRRGQELAKHGSSEFPVACYQDDLHANQVPWHWHEELEAVLVCEGTLLLGIADRQYTLGAGEGCLVNSGILHSCQSRPSGICRIRSVVFHPRLIGGTPDSIFYQNYLQPLLDRKDAGCLLFSGQIPWQSQILSCVESAWALVAHCPAGYEFDVRHQLSRIFGLLQAHLPDSVAEPDRNALRRAGRLKQMLQFIHAHYPERITVTDIAQSAAISESECLRCFRSVIRQTPIQYLRQYRVQQAAHLLRSTQEKIAAIAAACGFEDMSFFTKTFHTLIGETPSAYRLRPTDGENKA